MKSNILSQYDIIIFDCDGVLLDVNLKKCEAFGEAVKGYSEHTITEFVNHCKNTFGVSRYVKFKEFIIDFAKEPYDENTYNKLLKNYANLCGKIYRSAEITPGAINLLKELNLLNKRLYIASGSDEEELKNVLKDRNLNTYFKGIFGSPKTKLECTSNILKANTYTKALFIGDALSDMKTAKTLGIDFIYMSKFSVQSLEQKKQCQDEAVKVVSTLEDLI